MAEPFKALTLVYQLNILYQVGLVNHGGTTMAVEVKTGELKCISLVSYVPLTITFLPLYVTLNTGTHTQTQQTLSVVHTQTCYTYNHYTFQLRVLHLDSL